MPLLLIVAVGGALRAAPVAANGFPLNDGGLFVAMIKEIQNAGPIPSVVHYNGETLPFAYPPLGFYLAAAFIWLTGAGWSAALQVLPVFFSVCTIPVVYLLYRQIFESEFRAVLATGAFAVIPRSFNWAISGGGITRGLGLLAAIAALAFSIAMFRTGSKRATAFTGALLGITALSHPQAAVFAGTSLFVLLPFYAPSLRVGIRRLAIAAAIGALIAGPWLVYVAARYGPPTLIGAAETGGSIFDSLVIVASMRLSGGLVEVLGVAGAFGLLVAVINRRWLLPVWLLVTLVVSSRAGLNYGAIMLAGGVAYALADVLKWLKAPEPTRAIGQWRSRVTVAIVLVLSVAALADSAASGMRPLSPLHGLSADTRAALTWIRNNTTPGSVVLVASGTSWSVDSTSEWLPVLTGRRSTITVQGTEWLGPGVFAERKREYIWLQACAADARQDCLPQWDDVIEHVDFVLAKRSSDAAALGIPCCLAWADELESQGATLVFASESVVVLRTDGAISRPISRQP